MTDTAELERLAASITQGLWKIHKCLCGHPSCAQFTISNQGSVGFDEDDAQAITLVPDLLAEVIALRAEVERLEAIRKNLGDMAMLHLNMRNTAEARATAAEADAERLAAALDAMGDVCNSSLGDAALAAHTQRVNEKEGE